MYLLNSVGPSNMWFRSLLALLFATPLLATAQCPEWIKTQEALLPECPEGNGPKMVPETYPLAAVVVSDSSTHYGTGFTPSVVEKVLKAAGDNPPIIILPTNDLSFANVQKQVDAMSGTPAQKAKWKASLVHIKDGGYTWQQDYMQPFVDPKTGQVILRRVYNYFWSGESYQKVSGALAGCGFIAGEPLVPNQSKQYPSGAKAGNIETLPGGICMVGTDNFASKEDYNAYAKQACGNNPADLVSVPTSWMMVGHTDEVVRVVRNKSRKAPCDFSVVVASPKKALEILKQNPNDDFLGFSGNTKENKKKLTDRRIGEAEGLKLLCKKIAIQRAGGGLSPKNRPVKANSGTAQTFPLQRILLTEAIAAEQSNLANSCQNISNAEIVQLLQQDQNLKTYNELVQREMDSLKADIQAKMKNKLPSCEMDFIEAPDLFYGGEVVEGPNGPELPRNMGLSILPNPANSITANDTLISPEPGNEAYKKYLTDEYRKRGLTPEYVDTFDYSHMSNGNLHCATNTIHICKPRVSK